MAKQMNEDLIMEKELDELREKHKTVDLTIRSLLEKPFQDQLKVMRLKREKLQLKDAIYRLEQVMYPDIIA